MLRSIVSVAIAATASAGVTRAIVASRDHLPGVRGMERTNHAGNAVSLIEGPAVAAGALTGILTGTDSRLRIAALTATGAAAAFGALDDFAESGSAKGLRGHLSALKNGQVTTGLLKILGISAAGIAAAAIASPRGRGTGAPAHLINTVIAGGVIAGAANLFNLLDLRPGRALKAALGVVAGSSLRPAPAALLASVAGAAAAAWPEDLAGDTMLGDTGANALGALLGTHFVATGSPRSRAAALSIIAGLTVASEKISFTKVIENTPVLREIDALGRQ